MSLYRRIAVSHGYQLPGIVLLGLVVIALACGGENLTGPEAGTLEVTSSTTGVELDTDGYTIQIDGGTAHPLGPNTTIRRTEVGAGPHSVLVGGISPNCAVEGDNPRSLSIIAGETTSITLAVTCAATTGSVRVTSNTTGSSPDPDGFTVTVDGGNRGTLAPDGETSIDDLSAGSHTLGLGGVSGNCQVEGDNPRPLTIVAGSTSHAAFSIVCQAPPANSGTLEVSTTTTGPGADADGYVFSVDGSGSQPIGANATVAVSTLATGAHSVQLSGIADHCTLQGNNPRSVTVPGGGTVAVTFSLNCQAMTGSIAVTTTTSGLSADPDGYVFTIDAGSAQTIDLNATEVVAGQTAGVHNVRLSGAAATCVIEGANPRTVTVTAGNTAAVTFAVVCSSGTIVITTNPPVSALSGEVFDPAVQPVVQVKDGRGNPLVGVQVAARIASGSGDLEGTSNATSDASGFAAFADLGIRGTGEQTLELSAGGATVTSSPVIISPLPAEATRGKWGPVVPWDIVPLHMSLLPNGKIFAWGKTDVADTMGMPRIWDPASGSPNAASEIHVEDMLFCAGHTLMPDGRLMVAGGHHRDDAGIKVTYFFSQDGSPTQGPDMTHGRWYPTLTVLSDGRVVSMAGRNQAGTVVRTPEIWENNQWVELPGAGTLEIPYYPRNFVDPKNGRLFYASERIQSRWFNVDASATGGRGSWASGPTHIYRFNRDYGSAVMYDAGKILVVGGGGHTGWPTPDPKASAPTATAETIDLNRTAPSWQSTGSMAFRRRHMNATILPDGQVLATGGTRGGGFVNIDPGLAVREAEVWNPVTGQWTTLAANSVMRVYHSVALLLPNGSVLHGASGDAMAGTTPIPPERNHEIFQPPYLFKGVRPSISSAPSSVAHGQTFSVATPNAGQIENARWIRLGSVTHAFDMSQRANTLSFTRTASGVEITAPASPHLAPPGHYLLFLLNRNGVPSVGRVLKVQ